MALTRVAPAGIGSTPGTGYVIGDSFLHSTGLNATNAYYTGIVTAQTFRVLGNFQVDGTTTTLDTEITSVDKLEVEANNTTVGVAITQSGSGDILNLYDGSSEVFSVADGGNVGIKNATGLAEFAVDVGGEIASKNANKEFIGINLTSNEARIRSSFYSGASGAYRPITFYTSDAERLRITSGGNVGIGTDSPGELLHLTTTSGNGKIRIDAASAASIDFYNSGTRLSDIFTDASTSNLTITNRQNADIIVRTNGTNERLRITSDGNVIIGSGGSWSYPKALNVQGASGSILSLYNADTTSYAQDTSSAIEFKLLTGNTGNTTGACELRAFKENGTNGNNARGLSFWTGGNGGGNNERLRITSAGLVGIGLTNPTTKLDVLFDDDSGIKFDTISSTAGTLITSYHGSNNSNVRSLHFDAQHFVVNTGAPQGTSTTERLRITSAGLVGINQDSPSEKLEIYAGDILLSGNANGVSGGIGPDAALKFEYNGHQYAKIVGNGRDSSGYGDIDFYTSTSAGVTNLSQRMTIRADGKIGIGEDTPGSKLDIKGSASNTVDIRLRNTESNTQMSLYAFGGTAATGSHFNNRIAMMSWSDTEGIDMITNGTGDNDFRVYTGGYGTNSERFRIRSDGDVVIGTSDLESNLGSRRRLAVCDTTNGALLHLRGQSPAIFFDQSGGNIGKIFLDSVDFAIQSGTPASEGTERLRITSGGEVLIGHTTASNLAGGFTKALAIEGTGAANSSIGLVRNANDDNPPYIYLGKSRGSAPNANNAISNGDNIGMVNFAGAKGSGIFGDAVNLRVHADASFTASSSPGRFSVWTTPVNSTSPVERLRITSGGRILTTKGTNIAYTASGPTITDNLIFSSININSKNPGSAQWYDMKAFNPHKDGSVAISATMYITSGTYYFNYRVVDNTDTEVFNAADGGGYNAYVSPAGQSGNVHTYKTYKWVCSNLRADRTYRIQMAASPSNGSAVYANASQQLFLKDLRIFSESPGNMYAAPNIQILQDIDEATSTAYGGTTRSAMNNNSNTASINHYQTFAGTESKFLGWYTIRAYNRYLDIKLSVNYTVMWFAQAYGYLYSSGQVCGSMISGYTYNNNTIINKYTHTFGNRGWYGSYRDSGGYLCLKFDRGTNGYSEGRIAIFYGGHYGNAAQDVKVIEYRQNDSTSNVF